MQNTPAELYEALSRLAPFALRARAVATGREKLLQHRNQLAFLLVTEDLSDNSRRETLRDFPCPVYEALTAPQVETLFHFHNTKLLGFSRCSLSSQIQQLLKGRRLVAPSIDEVTMPDHPKVAVLGASGVGRYHANWWERAGGEVVGFLGSSPESIQRTADNLCALLGHPVKGHDNLERLLQHCQPDIVDVCLPPALHYRTARAALLSGCHVLCEKPFLYDASLPPAVLHQQCTELLDAANARNRLLGMCSQYYEVARQCLAMMNPAQPITRLDATLATPRRNHAPGPLSSWLDLGAHLLAVLQAVALTRHLLPSSIEVTTQAPNQLTAHFSCTDRSDTLEPPPPLECRLTAAHQPADATATHQRLIQLDGTPFEIQSSKGPDGQFAMAIQAKDMEQPKVIPDTMRTLIGEFAHGRAVISGRLATQNLNWLLKIAEEIPRKHRP